MPRSPTLRDARASTVSSRGVRTVRAGIASAVAVFVSLTFHVAAGGALPTPAVLVIALVLSMPFAVLLIGRRLSIVRLAGVVVAAQAEFHTLFGFGVGTGLGAGEGLGAGGHGMHGAAAQLSAVQVQLSAAGSPLGPVRGGMTASHLLAAAVTVLALRLGEGAFWALAALATWRVRRMLTVRLQVLSAAPFPADRLTSPLVSQLLGWRAVRHRGPPIRA